jgi:predicted esterase
VGSALPVNPHLAEPPALAGAALGKARAAAVVVHGRGQEPAYMLDNLVARLDLGDVAYVLPGAAGNSWYPARFLAAHGANEPWLGHSLQACAEAVELARSAGIPTERIVLVGFSQGACLVADFAARNPEGWGGLAILTGALLGAEGHETPVAPQHGLPVFMSASRLDGLVPVDRVEATARAFEAAGARVTLHLDEDPEHRISDDAVAGVRALLT